MTMTLNENVDIDVYTTIDNRPLLSGKRKSLSRVDVVVPCYNYARYLRDCVESVLSQRGVNVRVLVIDDASTDETPQVGKELAAADGRVEFRRHEVNKGHIATTINENANINLRGTIDDRALLSGNRKSLSTVDVVIPCYNYGRYLRACVDSVLSQVGVCVRVLVIDDASTDETPQVGQDIASADDRVEFRRHEANKGHIATYNEGLIDWSTADYTVLLSSDDLLTPGSLSRATRIMDADKHIGMVYGRAIHFRQGSNSQASTSVEFAYTRFSGAEWLERRCRAGHNVITSPEVVVRGSVQRTVGGYRAELPHTGDLEMWLRIAAMSDIAYVRGVPQALYRVHPRSMVRTKYHCSFLDLQERKAAFDSFFRENRDSIIDDYPDADC